jgi:hypothetical protein
MLRASCKLPARDQHRAGHLSEHHRFYRMFQCISSSQHVKLDLRQTCKQHLGTNCRRMAPVHPEQRYRKEAPSVRTMVVDWGGVSRVASRTPHDAQKGVSTGAGHKFAAAYHKLGAESLVFAAVIGQYSDYQDWGKIRTWSALATRGLYG